MVQEHESSQQSGKLNCQAWDNTSRKTGFQAIQSKGQEKKVEEKKQNPWGPVFKDRKNFNSLHHC
ncbi:hypothetical protein RN001_006422 [Aquatica leii]|uniref:Uncharacterized protein n=1 Tax=Aquatica leii TaxID=1421715 RepID=A0AAN7PE25_9COLE|nr:hypothetical protein RN001_006422 [Aquatica leii]